MRSRQAFLTIVALAVGGCGHAVRTCKCTVEAPTLTSDRTVPAVAIYRVPSGHRLGRTPEELEPQVIIAVWPDGRVVWSRQWQQGGRPYLAGRTSPVKLRAFFASLQRQNVSEETLSRHSWFGPDSDYLAIVVCEGRYCLRLESWHELFETYENVVATAAGVRTRGEQSRPEVLAEQPDDYRRFRESWARIRKEAHALTPAAGEPADGLHFKITTHPAP